MDIHDSTKEFKIKPLSVEDLADILDMVECLIDTAGRTTDMEAVYDDSRSKYMQWKDVWWNYHKLKAAVGVI